MATLSSQQCTPAGLSVSFSAASGGGDAIDPSRVSLLVVKNDDASSKTVTITRPGTQYGQAIPDPSLSVAAGAVAVFLVPASFADTDSLVDVTYSAVTNLSVAAVDVVDA